MAEVLVPKICALGMIFFMKAASSTASSARWIAVCIRIIMSPFRELSISWFSVSESLVFEIYCRFHVNISYCSDLLAIFYSETVTNTF